MDVLADGDEGLGPGVVALIGHTHVHHFNGGHLQLQLFEVQRLIPLPREQLPPRSGGSGSGFGLFSAGQIPLSFRNLGSMTARGADHHAPAGELLLNLALHHSNLAGMIRVRDLICC